MSLSFTEEQIERYSRHIILPEVGGKGQQKLLNARVFLVGAGGLGSPAAFYLAAAGVGKIGIADGDCVDYSNLQRQILHSAKDVGRSKAISAKETLEALNPDVEVIPYTERLTSGNILDIIKDYDVILDGADNFPTRYLVNDACVFLRKPLSHGSIFRFEGQVTTILPFDGPCYRCLYEEPPPPGLVPSCKEAGVLGILAGVIGTLQATEAIKLILGKGQLLKGKLLIYDSLNMEFKKVNVRKNPNCPVCSDKATIKELIDYEEFCQINT
ncbi:sulfur carrier protein adenylyltransferase [Candidatus Kuenenia stuttgartiensis]|jgi:adenylyltransferase/sulfurtransferase|uniref:Molybdopterin-synthase adenylyltransferase n=1 Tax=Kuenenia stuttgartiensis TaxID=174633 RepID=Q1PV71_KUEST|nr:MULTISPECIES: molybdopterin-synthase adenylyltransferase MoeB [Kuenenia]MBE7546155.1 molybdopterin-synthase adenylyltransferase MoeB [Planctomycetia bacterium]MBZ0193029.1 molybdopterin-synthase adenylyltransferase MoeB [Candidatus Kuenenia stuttgartiensis]MCF6152399.1 molybdopterin-synthase adenylyltransferase MoeB [Candidatus Kuenenia stuttgartiensis]MCL4726583.1 molybdopterin-synthase adenylyltransferase MoeB [Candidatus Kuenenia stuttgartiensis]MCZ7621464.1 molybdopterin-synthase adenyl